jgi:hypothetical protein
MARRSSRAAKGVAPEVSISASPRAVGRHVHHPDVAFVLIPGEIQVPSVGRKLVTQTPPPTLELRESRSRSVLQRRSGRSVERPHGFAPRRRTHRAALPAIRQHGSHVRAVTPPRAAGRRRRGRRRLETLHAPRRVARGRRLRSIRADSSGRGRQPWGRAPFYARRRFASRGQEIRQATTNWCARRDRLDGSSLEWGRPSDLGSCAVTDADKRSAGGDWRCSSRSVRWRVRGSAGAGRRSCLTGAAAGRRTTLLE